MFNGQVGMMLRFAIVILGWLALAATADAAESRKVLKDYTSTSHVGDFSTMQSDGAVRVLVPYSMTTFFIDDGREKGLVVEVMEAFERHINSNKAKGTNDVKIVLIPTRRDVLIPALTAGEGDLIAGSLTITPERQRKVAFSDPLLTDVQEIVVTHKGAPDITELANLSGLEIHVRESSSYYDSLRKANRELRSKGLAPVKIIKADEGLEDENLLEMVNTGIIPATVVDDIFAEIWSDLYRDIKLQKGFAVRDGGSIAWAFRKDSPQFQAVINDFVKTAKQTAIYKDLSAKRFHSQFDLMVNPLTKKYEARLNEYMPLFEKYGKKYKIDPLLVAAQAFQESRFDPKAHNPSGAVGMMQILPSTARSRNIGIRDVYKVDGNIEAGTKYMRFVSDYYFGDPSIPDLQRLLFTFAAYDAGPGRVSRVRKEAIDPDRWFDSVEWEVARVAGTEPTRYVKNIYVYYLAFKGLKSGAESQ